jgi:transposase
MAYPLEFRKAVAAAYDECGSSIDVAAQFHCSESWVRRLIQRRREDGSLLPRPPKRPDLRKLKEKDMAELARLIDESPDMTLQELADALPTAVSRATKRLQLPLKKVAPRRRTGTPGREGGPGRLVRCPGPREALRPGIYR